jgi:hypothetical protein
MFARHVGTHGFALKQYYRTFSPDSVAAPLNTASQAASTASVAAALLGSSEFIAPLADEVATLLSTGPQRKQLLLALSSLIATRLDAHGRAVSAFERVRTELTEPHRIERGENGVGVASTKDLVAVGALLRAEVAQGEDLLLKVAKLSVEEGKNKSVQTEIAGRMLDRFTGDAEAIPVPVALSAGERETVRALLGVLARPTRATTLDAVASRPSAPSVAHPPVVDAPAAPAPVAAPRQSTRRSFDDDLGF